MNSRPLETGKSVADVLNAAADVLEPEGRWTQEHLGYDGNGDPLLAEELAEAVCFCMAGAVWIANGLVYPEAAFEALRPVIGGGGVGPWNDAPGRTQAEVVAALREAASKARGQE